MQLARYIPTDSPHQYRVAVPPRAAYSHSASLGSRYGWPAARDSQPTYWPTSSQLTLCTGVRSSATRMRGRNLHAPAAMQAFHSLTVTVAFTMVIARTSTLCALSASGSCAPSPIMNPPLAMRTIRGQAGQSWNRLASPPCPRDAPEGAPSGGTFAAVLNGGDADGGSLAGVACLAAVAGGSVACIACLTGA